MAGVPTGILTLSGGGAGTQNAQRHDWAGAVWDMAGVSTAMPYRCTAALYVTGVQTGIPKLPMAVLAQGRCSNSQPVPPCGGSEKQHVWEQTRPG